jgi:hypothetical protein
MYALEWDWGANDNQHFVINPPYGVHLLSISTNSHKGAMNKLANFPADRRLRGVMSFKLMYTTSLA